MPLLGAGCRAFPRDVALDVAAASPGEGGWGSRFEKEEPKGQSAAAGGGEGVGCMARERWRLTFERRIPKRQSAATTGEGGVSRGAEGVGGSGGEGDGAAAMGRGGAGEYGEEEEG